VLDQERALSASSFDDNMAAALQQSLIVTRASRAPSGCRSCACAFARSYESSMKPHLAKPEKHNDFASLLEAIVAIGGREQMSGEWLLFFCFCFVRRSVIRRDTMSGQDCNPIVQYGEQDLILLVVVCFISLLLTCLSLRLCRKAPHMHSASISLTRLCVMYLHTHATIA
jgi:hypothetical protein